MAEASSVTDLQQECPSSPMVLGDIPPWGWLLSPAG